MNLQNRVEKLEQAMGTGAPCPVCDAPPRAEEKPAYDESVWHVSKTYDTDIACVHCGRPRRIVINVIERRDEREN
jgi:hypothetical protein